MFKKLLISLFLILATPVLSQEIYNIQRYNDRPYVALIVVHNNAVTHDWDHLVLEEGDIRVEIEYRSIPNSITNEYFRDREFDPGDILTVTSVSDGYLVVPAEMVLPERTIGFFYVYTNELM